MKSLEQLHEICERMRKVVQLREENAKEILEKAAMCESGKDADGNTVAILLAKNRIIPPNEWYYRELKNPFITILLHEKGIELPKKNIWYKDVTKGHDENGDIVTLIEIK